MEGQRMDDGMAEEIFGDLQGLGCEERNNDVGAKIVPFVLFNK